MLLGDEDARLPGEGGMKGAQVNPLLLQHSLLLR